VDEPVVSAIAGALQRVPGPETTAALTAARVLLEDPVAGHWRLDLRRATALQLQQLGIGDERIAICPLCTASEPLLFHSWRRDQVKAVQWSGIVSQA
jgi:hypothetical protein